MYRLWIGHIAHTHWKNAVWKRGVTRKLHFAGRKRRLVIQNRIVVVSSYTQKDLLKRNYEHLWTDDFQWIWCFATLRSLWFSKTNLTPSTVDSYFLTALHTENTRGNNDVKGVSLCNNATYAGLCWTPSLTFAMPILIITWIHYPSRAL